MPQHLIPIQTAKAIAKLEENWSLPAVAKELHCRKTCKEALAIKQAARTPMNPV
jgi:hypothetical protein